jgi:hypothetical protein
VKSLHPRSLRRALAPHDDCAIVVVGILIGVINGICTIVFDMPLRLRRLGYDLSPDAIELSLLG